MHSLILLLLAALFSVGVTIAIVVMLVKESLVFFQHVSVWEFLTGTQWTPLFDDAKYGILPLLSGTLVSSMVALIVAIPLGTIIAIYLSEFAPFSVREVAKPFLELLGGVPTIVYGYFALLFVTGSKGFLVCGAFDLEAINSFGGASAMVDSSPENPIGTLENFPNRVIKKVNEKAKALGIIVGMDVNKAFELIA